jgi:hypothetical protein
MKKEYECLIDYGNGRTQILLHMLIAHDIKYCTVNKNFGWLLEQFNILAMFLNC